MKSVKKILVLAIAFILIFSFCGCGGPSFLSNSEINSLVNRFGNPQAIVTIEYTTDQSQTIRLDITYNLLLKEVPITVANFINLVVEGFYNGYEKEFDGETISTNHIFHTRNSGTNAWITGSYMYGEDDSGSGTYHVAPEKDYTILGEFYQNGWIHALTDAQVAEYEDEGESPDDYDNNPKIELFSLAMYQEIGSENFNGASTSFFLTTSSHNIEDHRNYAVFAHLASITVTKIVEDGDDEVLFDNVAQVPASVINDFNVNLTATGQKDVFDDDGDSTKPSILTQLIKIVSITMVPNGKDFSAMPKYTIPA